MRTSISEKARDMGVRLFPFLTVIVLWESLARLKLVSPLFLPALSVVLERLLAILADGTLLRHLSVSLYRILFAYVLAAGAGVLFGLVIGLFPALRRFFNPLIAATYPLPKLAMLSFFLIWLGFGSPPIIAILMLSIFYPILINTIAGITTVDETLIKAAYNLGAGHRQVLQKVILPGSLPVIFGGFRIAASTSLLVVVAVEIYIADAGIGYLLRWATEFYRMDLLYALIIAIGLLGIVIFALIDGIEKWIIPWKQGQSGNR